MFTLRNGIILAIIAAIVALPFVLRPARNAGGAADGGKRAARVDDTLVIITPHNEVIRQEFQAGFVRWWRERTGRTVYLDWRNIGGASEIARYLEGEYTAAFRNHWVNTLGRPWSFTVQSAFANGRLPADASPEAKEARAAFLASNAGCGIDLFFGGGAYDFVVQDRAGRLVDNGVMTLHPDWFGDGEAAVIPRRHAGDDYRGDGGRWYGTVLSAFGIVYNRVSLARIGLPEPRQWTDLADPRYMGEVALADPTKSGSINKAFENVIQQQMQRRVAAVGGGVITEGGSPDPPTARSAAIPDGAAAPRLAGRETRPPKVAEGWADGLRLIQRIAANSRYFTDSAQKVPIDVAAGNCAAGMCIDFYGRQQAEALLRRGGSDRLAYVSPEGGTSYSVDPIGLLRGAPNPEVARAFIEYVLSMDGQRLWDQRPGTPGGPERFALRRLPVRRDFYALPGIDALRSDPEERPYEVAEPLIYHPEWTGMLFNELRFIIRALCIDSHAELVSAWRAIHAARASGDPAAVARADAALAVMQDVSAVDYAASLGRIKTALGAKDKAEEIRLAAQLSAHFRSQYRRAAELAGGG
ncbi:ABC transporter substrate-binding protein [Geminisphaera colitermitum]|uniref:ABC transporter substrate-binding protein n=1 Tax=Geminisphaera colitermitum TaxID=1148786 RepID=UPI0001964E3F|nr:extracellular solute-binding protein [Geminisphaera colitermitum]